MRGLVRRWMGRKGMRDCVEGSGVGGIINLVIVVSVISEVAVCLAELRGV